MSDWDFDFTAYLNDFFTGAADYAGDTASSIGSGLAGAVNDAAATSGSWFDSILGTLKTPGVLPALQSGAGILTSALGGTAQQAGISKALSELKSAYGMAGNTQAEQYNKALAMTRPYRELGAGVLPTLGAYASGLSPGRTQLGQMVGNGLYNWQSDQLNNQINKQLAARGRYDSGAGLKTLADAQLALGAQEADKKFGRQLSLENMDYGRLLDTANLGMGAAAGGAGLAANQGLSASNLSTGLGTALAQGSTAMGNATASMYGGANKSIQGGLANLYSQLGF